MDHIIQTIRQHIGSKLITDWTDVSIISDDQSPPQETIDKISFIKHITINQVLDHRKIATLSGNIMVVATIENSNLIIYISHTVYSGAQDVANPQIVRRISIDMNDPHMFDQLDEVLGHVEDLNYLIHHNAVTTR